MMDTIWTNNKLILILKLILISIFFAGNVSEANAGIYCIIKILSTSGFLFYWVKVFDHSK